MKISSWTRHDHNTMPPAAKTVGNYVNSSLAKVEALKAGYDEAIMLAPNGLVAECTGENIFAVRNGIIITPPLSAGALEGITQNSVMTHRQRPRHGHPRRQPRPQRPVHRRGDLRLRHGRRDQQRERSVDDREVPVTGPITKAIAEVYIDAANGKVDRYKDWNELAV